MNILTVVNIKCGGCEKKITDALGKAGLTNVTVDVANQKVSFEGDVIVGRKILSGLGYPEAGTAEADSAFKKAHSYISCASVDSDNFFILYLAPRPCGYRIAP